MSDAAAERLMQSRSTTHEEAKFLLEKQMNYGFVP